ncbi:39S ribosomal protein L47, mitochondrial-like isoform X2 [Anopheles albimanus]|uniref:Large ribosomal subunit protein uL29m n=1 Tax=Anopheles albimanus TaxID=7167 RepID=A0A182FAZ7_ANOAL|nr:39S ribosomal protein L47, mitochondrial-like isoform X2 [Anopheles albimanus]
MNIFKQILPFSQHLARYVTGSGSQRVSSALHRFTGASEPAARMIGTTAARHDLSEFFEDKKNWGEQEIKHGRGWTKDDMRIKSNADLHKLWFVLLKERNMLLTMEHECKEKMELFPSPERLDKVKESMENLESVIRERNRAYFELETGETGERPGRVVTNQLGTRFYYRAFEHVIPKFANSKWNERHRFSGGGYAVWKFQRLYRERVYNEKRKLRNRERNEVVHLLRRFPNIDRETLAQRFPSVDVEKLYKLDKIRSNQSAKDS